MNVNTGDIITQEQYDKLPEAEKADHTPLTPQEEKALRPKNRHERRAFLVQFRRAQKELAKKARAKAKLK